jgi:hypothetical protein
MPAFSFPVTMCGGLGVGAVRTGRAAVGVLPRRERAYYAMEKVGWGGSG